MKSISPAPLILAGVWIIGGLTAQATIYVDGSNTNCPGQGTRSNPYCQIQTGIQAAIDGATVLVMPGVYNEAIDFLGKAITVRGQGGPRTTIIDGQQRQVSVVTFKNKEGRNSVLEGFTIRNGQGSLQPFNSSQQIVGGGIACVGTSPTISNVVLTANIAKYGAGAYGVQGSKCLLKDVLFTGNNAITNGGGAVFMDSTPSFVDCVFAKNTCGHTGGGLNVRGSAPFLANCVFDGNSATDMGGGIRIGALSSGTLVNCSFWGNTSRYGGGLAAGSDTQGTVGLVSIANSIFWNNTASYGPELSLNGRYPCNMNISYSDARGGKNSVYVQSGFTLTWGAGMIDSDPLFADPSGGDFHIPYTSPCRDSGNSQVSGLQSTDFEGDPRAWGSTADMGADEFFPRLYHTGKLWAGGTVTIKVVGQPSTSATWYVGTAVLTPPLAIAGLTGALELAGVILAMPLGKLPLSGLATIPPIAVPLNTPPMDVPCQALIGTHISNLDVVSIR
jgi:predicted outer membrane repeat protein